MSSWRRNLPTNGPWEASVGYSRAVRVADHVFVSGSTAMTPAGLVGRGDPYTQTKQALATIREALEKVGAALEDVVRTRMFVTDITSWEAVGRAHGELFGAIRPAATMVEVRRLIDPEMLVEVEAEALVRPHGSPAGPAPSRRFSVLPGSWTVVRLDAFAPVPSWALDACSVSPLASITRTGAELSVVCPEDRVPGDARAERGWAVLAMAGPLPFSEVGVLASLAAPLSEAGVSIFVLSTFDTDHLLVKSAQLETALAALARAGHILAAR